MMELLQSSFLKNPNFCKLSNTTRNLPTKTIRAFTTFLHKRNPGRNSLEITVQQIPISHKASKRRNSLRKKLTGVKEVRNADVLSHRIRDKTNSHEKIDGGDNDRRIAEDNDERGESHNLELENESRHAELLSKLETWATRYKEDIEYWGIGSGPILTVFHDLDGNIKEVKVNEGEILERHRVQSSSESGNVDFSSAHQKILRARSIAKDIEAGNHRLSKDSSIAAFVLKENDQISSVGNSTINGDPSFSKISRFGFAFLCGFLIFGVAKKIFKQGGEKEDELRGMEKEMLTRKVKARKEREKMEKGSVEVLDNVEFDDSVGFTKKPQLDKEEVVKMILRTEASQSNVSVSASTETLQRKDYFDDKILEIRRMAKEARLVEKEGASSFKQGNPNELVPVYSEDLEVESKINANKDVADNEYIEVVSCLDESKNKGALLDTETYIIGESLSHNAEDALSAGTSEHGVMETLCQGTTGKNDAKRISSEAIYRGQDTLKYVEEEDKDRTDRAEKTGILETPSSGFPSSGRKLDRPRPRIIMSVEEASKYLSRKRSEQGTGADKMDSIHEKLSENISEKSNFEGETVGEELYSRKSEADKNLVVSESRFSNEKKELLGSISARSEVILSGIADVREHEFIDPCSEAHQLDEQSYEDNEQDARHTVDTEERCNNDQVSSSLSCSVDDDENGMKLQQQRKKESWIEANFDRFEPIVKKIGVGFKDNYMIAREKVQDEVILTPEIEKGSIFEEYDELEWMKDDTLREIVFKVRENEMAGRDPFHMILVEDQDKFFKGLEKKVEKANAKLLGLHEWIHSRVENLDYGADGISIYDPPEKVIPRWKGPTIDKDPEFLNEFSRVRRETLGDKKGVLSIEKLENWLNDLDKEEPVTSLKDVSSSSTVDTNLSESLPPLNPKTVIESSDGSTRQGKKSGKEYWQHTKKWSEEFLQVYNSETDPEVKGILKDMGKDLDRWITPGEIQEAADLMDRSIPKRKKKYIEKKLEQLKRECQLYGSQAVADKYREYAEQKEEDYFWWLDLPYVLCIELYTSDERYERIGFYSLEMGADFELDPKQYHVIAFENRTDARHLCYIIQTHMEIIGNGHAFVIAIPPKDAFREAKANGFNVMVIRKGELQLDIDKTLEDVEREIVEIGSKMYYDKYIRENEVSVEGIWKGLFKGGKTTKRRPMRTSTKTIKG